MCKPDLKRYMFLKALRNSWQQYNILCLLDRFLLFPTTVPTVSGSKGLSQSITMDTPKARVKIAFFRRSRYLSLSYWSQFAGGITAEITGNREGRS
ncbi:hypothetical protein M472_08940 [Sphingobacterium paucimobilis HER1398]|uniref:Uncharacterized protein n=1 Tax=Sphingobacterium paucimobilis HER1398 TaxID=1346330 RepID=U2HUD1_9SPHI|nr:hypothetical protein M472_08940 [Sphingobacterium paucimobilis HER1398]